MTVQDNRTGILLMVMTMLIFAIQDAISQHLARNYNVFMIVMIRYWFFAAFAISLASRQSGGLRAAASTRRLALQIFRGVLLAAEICVMVTAFVHLGLVESLAIFASYPLIVVALSGPILGETVGPRRWMAVGIGFLGVLVILQPGLQVFSPLAIIPMVSTVMFALYGLLTRLASKADSTATSFFWTGTTGAVVMTTVGVWYWQPMSPEDWGWMIALCITGVVAHWCLIRSYELAEASALQPFAYLHLVFGAALGMLIFNETLRPNVAIGAAIVVLAGLFTLWRTQLQRNA